MIVLEAPRAAVITNRRHSRVTVRKSLAKFLPARVTIRETGTKVGSVVALRGHGGHRSAAVHCTVAVLRDRRRQGALMRDCE